MVQRKFSVAAQVFRELYPFGLHEHEPRSWAQHVRDNLAQEARAETVTYYGPERSYETRLPGLDYTYWPHRRRLSRYPHHNALFAAMDRLALTPHEIYELCCWDCTLNHKDRYITQHPSLRHVRDTTGEDIPKWEDIARQERYEHAAALIQDESEAEEGSYMHEGEEQEEEQDTDKEDAETGEEDETYAGELAIERQGPRVATRPIPVSANAQRMVSLSATSVRA